MQQQLQQPQQTQSPVRSREVGPLALPWSASARGGGRGTQDTGHPNADMDATAADATRHPAAAEATGTLPAATAGLAIGAGTAADLFTFMKGLTLSFDPVKEAETLWIAEEFMQMPLPPGWTQHTSPQGVFFYNSSTPESTWQHPNEQFFHEMVATFKSVQQVGGFWYVDDELEGMEDKIRAELSSWMELFDEKGERFFFNKDSQESRLDDPRDGVYHKLYNKIRIVAKMKEKLPLLARAPRPEEPTPHELDLLQHEQDERSRYLAKVVKIQCFIRVCLAKKRLRHEREKRMITRGTQPLKGLVKLSIEGKGKSRRKELRLASTAEHRRHRAATKIQTACRRYLAIKRVRPLLEHRRFLSKQASKIQRQVRPWAAEKRHQRLLVQMKEDRAVDIQRVWRGRQHREYARGVKKTQKEYLYYQSCVIKIQALVRRFLARCEVFRRRAKRRTDALELMKSSCQVFLAKKELVTLYRKAQPVQARFTLTATDAKEAAVMPWTFRLLMPAVTDEGHTLPEPHGVVDLFEKAGLPAAPAVAAARVQKVARGNKIRTLRERARQAALDTILAAADAAVRQSRRRGHAATRIQALVRRFLVRCRNPLGARQAKWREAIAGSILEVQALIRRHLAQEALLEVGRGMSREWAATIIQARWRARLARKRVQYLALEALCPVKAWFSFDDTPAGCAASSMQVKLMPNPKFDDWKFFCRFGDPNELTNSLSEMSAKVTAYVDRYFAAEPVMAELDARIKALVALKTPDEELRQQEAALRLATPTSSKVLQEYSREHSKELHAASGSHEVSKDESQEIEPEPSVISLKSAGHAVIPPSSATTAGSEVATRGTDVADSEMAATFGSEGHPEATRQTQHSAEEALGASQIDVEMVSETLSPVPEHPECEDALGQADDEDLVVLRPSNRAVLPAGGVASEGLGQAGRARSGSPVASNMLISPSSPVGLGERKQRTPPTFGAVGDGLRSRSHEEQAPAEGDGTEAEQKRPMPHEQHRSKSQPVNAPLDGVGGPPAARRQTGNSDGGYAEVVVEEFGRPLPELQKPAVQAQQTPDMSREHTLQASTIVVEPGSAGPAVMHRDASGGPGYPGYVREAATAPTQVRAPARESFDSHPLRPRGTQPEEHWPEADRQGRPTEGAEPVIDFEHVHVSKAKHRLSVSDGAMADAMAKLMGVAATKNKADEREDGSASSSATATAEAKKKGWSSDPQDRPPSSPPQKGRLLLMEELMGHRAQQDLIPLVVAARRRHHMEEASQPPQQQQPQARQVAADETAAQPPSPAPATDDEVENLAEKDATASETQVAKKPAGLPTKAAGSSMDSMRHTFPGKAASHKQQPAHQRPRASSSASVRIRGKRQLASAALSVLKDAGLEFQAMSVHGKGQSTSSTSTVHPSGKVSEDSQDKKVEELVRRQMQFLATKTKSQQMEMDQLQESVQPGAGTGPIVQEQQKAKRQKIKQLKKLVKVDKRLPAAYQQPAGPWLGRGVGQPARLLHRHVHHHVHYNDASADMAPFASGEPGSYGAGMTGSRSLELRSLSSLDNLRDDSEVYLVPTWSQSASAPNLHAAQGLPPLGPCGQQPAGGGAGLPHVGDPNLKKEMMRHSMLAQRGLSLRANC
mmetsp:Transcript_6035/g.13309  ORF Transcript_6035/g.13309 Transcript_6035/m.13309 type:complete len:1615 (+) Transcript_6035:51-4895(+)